MTPLSSKRGTLEPYVQDPDLTLFNGDVREVLAGLPDESVNCVVTSPPYLGLRDYGIEGTVWENEPYADACEGEHEWEDTIIDRATNHTDKRRWQHTRNGRDEEQPPEKRVAWKRTDVEQGQCCRRCGAWFGTLGLEPSISLYESHVVDVFREIRRVLRSDGVAWLNLGDSYNAYNGNAGPGSKLSQRQSAARPQLASGHGLQQKSLKPKDLMMVPARVALALQNDGWWLRSEIIWCKPAPMPESVRDRPTRATERVYLLTKNERYWYDGDAIRETAEWARWGDQTVKKPQPGTASWIKPKSKQDLTAAAAHDASKRRYEGFNERWDASEANGSAPKTRNAWDWWVINTEPYPDAHFATFPTVLARRCILTGCPKDGVVLDPFFGSGTVGLVARREGRKCIGIEQNPEYCELAAERIERWWKEPYPPPPEPLDGQLALIEEAVA